MQQQQYPPPSNGDYGPVAAGQQYHQYGQHPQSPSQFQYDDQKVPFEQAFKIEKPKWNDVWAGFLFMAFMAGFVVVSGIALHGYGTTPPLLPSSCGFIFFSRASAKTDHESSLQPPRVALMARASTTLTSSPSTRILSSSSPSVSPSPSSSATHMSSWFAPCPSRSFGSPAS